MYVNKFFQVLVITGSANEDTINYGHKQVTLHKEELVFYHNGERHSFSMSTLNEISIVPANPNHSESFLDEQYHVGSKYSTVGNYQDADRWPFFEKLCGGISPNILLCCIKIGCKSKVL